MLPFKKAIISLDGVSSEIKNQEAIKQNIAYALRSLGLPFEYYQNKENGFVEVMNDMNQDDVVYVLNDSLFYHLCKKPCVLLTRSWPWVQSDPKPNNIGQITHEMLSTSPLELAGVIARNQPVRQDCDKLAAYTYLLFSQYFPNKSDAMGRMGAAQMTWTQAMKKDIHVRYLPYQSEGLPLVNEMLKEGMAQLEGPDDIIIILNSDICLVAEATGTIRTFMESRNIDCCFANRVDVVYGSWLGFDDIQDLPKYSGMDLFAFRAGSEVAKYLMSIPLYLGREGWDAAWASVVKNKLPWNVCYHWPHSSEWTLDNSLNEFNRNQIAQHFNLKSLAENGMVGYAPTY
jgi:hypothetical protein